MSADSTQAAVTVIGSRVPVDFAERVRLAAASERRSVSNFTMLALERELQRIRIDQPTDRQAS